MAKPQILLVEDDPEQLSLIKDFLHSIGYVVHAFAHPADALKWITEKKPMEEGESSLISLISDIIMPEIDGFSLIKKIRDHGLNGPALLITAAGNSKVAEEAEQLGAHYLEKPLHLDKLAKLLSKF